jgi:O-methyltransferase
MNVLSRMLSQFEEKRLTKIILPYTLVSPERARNLYRLAYGIERERIPGDVLECGVCNGGTAAILASSATRSPLQRTVWLLDSFQGMPDVTPEDGVAVGGRTAESHVGQEVGSCERVKEVLTKVGTNMNRVRILPGWFEDTFPSVTARQIALLNIDADWYRSVKLCLETFYDRVVTGALV